MVRNSTRRCFYRLHGLLDWITSLKAPFGFECFALNFQSLKIKSLGWKCSAGSLVSVPQKLSHRTAVWNLWKFFEVLRDPSKLIHFENEETRFAGSGGHVLHALGVRLSRTAVHAVQRRGELQHNVQKLRVELRKRRVRLQAFNRVIRARELVFLQANCDWR